MDDLSRQIAGNGGRVMEHNIQNDPITNKRVGTGLIHVRAKNSQELKAITGQLEATGMTVAVRPDYKPVWKN
jgi:hypothetical protein